MARKSSQAAMARATTSTFGKNTAAVRGLLPDEVKDAFTAKWRRMGYGSESDALREIVIVFTYGPRFLQKIHADRIGLLADNMAGIGTEEVS